MWVVTELNLRFKIKDGAEVVSRVHIFCQLCFGLVFAMISKNYRLGFYCLQILLSAASKEKHTSLCKRFTI
jgi:hypothetical protein